MGKPHKYRKLIICIAVVAMLAVSCPILAVKAVASENTVKVGVVLNDFIYKNKDGYEGYAVEYLNAIATYTGWEYEYIEGTVEECIARLKTGEIDLLLPMRKTDERMTDFVFSKHIFNTGDGAIITLPSNTDIGYEDFEALDGASIGAVLKNNHDAFYMDFCKAHGFSATIVKFQTERMLDDALDTGLVDAVFKSTMAGVGDCRIVAELPAITAYAMASKNQAKLMLQLDNALTQLDRFNPEMQQELAHKYLVPKGSVPSFTKDEMAFIKSCPPITVMYDANWAPIEYEENGEIKGVTAEIFEEIADLTGLQFSYQAGEKNYAEAMAEIEAKNIDIVTNVGSDFVWANQFGLRLTEATVNMPGAIVYPANRSGVNIRTIAMPRGYYITYLAERRSRAVIKYFDTVEQCFDAVVSGKVDATYCNWYTGSYFIQHGKYSRLQLKSQGEYEYDIAIGVSKGADTMLLSVINKAVDSISKEDFDRIVMENTGYAGGSFLIKYIYRHPVQITVFVCSVLAIVIIVMVGVSGNINRYNKKISDMLYIDEITGEASHKRFLEKAGALINNQSDSYALVYMDIRKFKYINDSYGYEEGDSILRNVADVLKKQISSKEIFARIYADHFTVLLTYENAADLDHRLKAMMLELDKISAMSKKNYHVSFAAGVYRMEPHEMDVDIGIVRANYAHELVTDSYTSTYIYYDGEMRSKMIYEKNLERDMVDALNNSEFEAYYQPRVRLDTGAVVGAEALARWNHPTMGLLQPGSFIPFFEHNGFITKLDYYIFEDVCRVMKGQMDGGESVVPVSCNFSRVDIVADCFVQDIVGIADKYGIPHNMLELEVTETAAVENIERVYTATTELSQKGFLISVDDFGEGYSSIKLIQKLPLNVLKIDRSFVQEEKNGKISREIMQQLVNVSHDNDIQVVFEGVETLEQEARVLEYNCNLVQGYLYGKPMELKCFLQKLTPKLPDNHGAVGENNIADEAHITHIS